MKIAETCESERPREKMLREGPSAMSNAELLAILLRTGTARHGAVDLAGKLLERSSGSLTRLADMSLQELSETDGVKTAKAVGICAAFELGRRFISEGAALRKTAVTDARDVFELMLPKLKGLSHEECWILLLNRARYLTHRCRMSSGGGGATVMDVRDIIAKALQHKASAIIMVHNHPSGNPRPGNADLQQTEALRRAADSMDIALLDHVIVCDDCYYSFCDNEVSGPISPCADAP